MTEGAFRGCMSVSGALTNRMVSRWDGELPAGGGAVSGLISHEGAARTGHSVYQQDDGAYRLLKLTCSPTAQLGDSQLPDLRLHHGREQQQLSHTSMSWYARSATRISAIARSVASGAVEWVVDNAGCELSVSLLIHSSHDDTGAAAGALARRGG